MKIKLLVTCLVCFLLASTAQADSRRQYRNTRQPKWKNSNSFSISFSSGSTDIRFAEQAGHRRYRKNYNQRYAYKCPTTVSRRIWVPDKRVKVWVEPEYQIVEHCNGTLVKQLISHGYYRYEIIPGHYEIIEKSYRYY